MDTFNRLICRECSFVAKNFKGLSYHVRKHGLKYPEYLVKHDRDGRWPTCECGCGERVKFFNGGFCSFVDHHFFRGRKQSIEVRSKISQTQSGRKMSEERKARQSEAMKKYHAKNDKLRSIVKANMTGRIVTEETRRKLSETRRAKIASGEIKINRDKISKTVSDGYIDGTIGWTKGTYIPKKCSKPCTYRSSWELTFMEKLDNDHDVLAWKHEPIVIEYMFNGNNRRYIPDFFVERFSNKKQIVEVKPIELRKRPMNVAKRAAALKYCRDHGYDYVEWDVRDAIEH